MKEKNTYQKKKENLNAQMRDINKKYREKMRSNGMTFFCKWIPKSILEKVKKYIEDICKNDRTI